MSAQSDPIKWGALNGLIRRSIFQQLKKKKKVEPESPCCRPGSTRQNLD